MPQFKDLAPSKQAYVKQSVIGLDRAGLVLFVYEEILLELTGAGQDIPAGKLEKAHFRLIKTQKLIHELMNAINYKAGPISDIYKKIYTDLLDIIASANLKKDIALIDQAAKILSAVRDSWKESIKLNKKNYQ